MAGRSVPWAVSFALHAAVIVVGFFITWSVMELRRQREPTRVVADFDATTFDPVAMVNLEPADRIRPAESPLDIPVPELDLPSDLVDVPPLPDLPSNARSAPSAADFAPRAAPGTASFVGLTSTNARKIVYVIDASGSMIATLPVVVQELGRSLTGLSEQQEFAIVFFQRNEALVVPPANRMSPATPDRIVAALEWIDANVIPVGRSNPLRALETAMRLEPDAIFLLSQNITGSGQFEIDQRDLLRLLDRLNPVDPDTGQRGVYISCIQFLDPDPLDTLRIIAERHGGPKAFKLLDRKELGLHAP